MIRKAWHTQNGLTLVELLVAMAIMAVVLPAVVTFFQTAMAVNRNINNEETAVNQLKNAFNYISRDTDQAATVATTNSNFPLTLSWGQSSGSQTTVVYSIVNGSLQRAYTGPLGPSTTNVASNVNSNATKTNCSWNSTNYDLTVNLTVSVANINAARQFIMTPRVVQSSSLLADTVTLILSNQTVTYGNPVTFTATVSPSTSSGTITFLNGNTTINISPIVGGTASYTVSNLTAGNYTNITAVYSGDAVYSSSKTASSLTLMVNQATPTLSLTNSPVTYNGSPQTATVNGSVAGVVSNILYNSSPTVPTSAGTYAITANFVPTDNTDYVGLPGVSVGNFIISQAPTTATVTSSSPYSTPGQAVTFTAGVTPNTAIGDTVKFYDGLISLGSSALGSNFQATFTTSTLSVGNHSITVVYNGDSNYAASNPSSAITQTVANATSNFTPSSGPVGTVTTVSGSGWAPNDNITGVKVGGVTATTYSLTVNGSGTLTGTIKIPSSGVGLQNIIITGSTTGAKTFTGAFKVTTVPTLTSIGQKNSTTTGTSIAVTLTGNVSTGNTIIVTFAMSSATGTVTISDTKNNIYTSDADINYSSYERTLVFSAPVTTALATGNTITITCPSSQYKAVSIYYVSGLVTPKDQSATATGSSTSPSSGNSGNTTQDYELIIGAIGYNNSSTFTAGGSFTALTKSTAGSNLTIQPEYRIVTSMGAYAASGSISTSGRWAAAVVTYKTQ